MSQIDTQVARRPKQRRLDWRGPSPEYQAAYLMKLGNIDRVEADALIDMFRGDRDKINAELVARRRAPAGVSQVFHSEAQLAGMRLAV